NLALQPLIDREHRGKRLEEHAVVLLADALDGLLLALAEVRLEDDAVGLQHAAHLIDDVGAHANDLKSDAEHRAHRMTIQVLHSDLAIPTHAHELGEPTGIVLVGLVQLHAEPRLRVTRIDADDGHTKLFQAVIVPCRQRTGFEADTASPRRLVPNRCRDRVRRRSASTLPTDASLVVNNANVSELL